MNKKGAMAEWGDAMRLWNGKASAAAARRSDVTLQYLGYSTDNGAYYYYNIIEDAVGNGNGNRNGNSEGMVSRSRGLRSGGDYQSGGSESGSGGGDYQSTLAAVRLAHSEKAGLPYRYALLDSWFYEHGPDFDGAVNWVSESVREP
jgi:hypothetical protein